MLLAALGIAVQVSSVEGAVVQTLAWAVVSASVFLVVMGSFAHLARCRRSAVRAREPRIRLGRSFAGDVLHLGKRILTFKHERDAGAPAWSAPATPIRHPLRASRARQEHLAAATAYEHRTLQLYDGRFAAHVRVAVPELFRREMLKRHEAERLMAPESAIAIEEIGIRLIELGKLLSRRPRQVA